MVDTGGLHHAIAVTTAEVTDRKGAGGFRPVRGEAETDPNDAG